MMQEIIDIVLAMPNMVSQTSRPVRLPIHFGTTGKPDGRFELS